VAARRVITGEPGTAWVNKTSRVAYQFRCSFQNSCARCIQYAGQISDVYWPVPLHRGCQCEVLLVLPGHAAAPFVDYAAEVARLGPVERRRVMGKSSYALVQSGAVEWTDVVTRTRIRPFAEVVERAGLSERELVRAGVAPRQARQARGAIWGRSPRPAAPVAAEPRRVAAAAPEPKAAAAAGPRAGPYLRFATYGTVDPADATLAQRAIAALPKPALDALRRRGTEFAVGRTMADAAPGLVSQRPRGWAAGLTWAQADGVYEADVRRVVVTTHRTPVGGGAPVPSDRWRSVLYHETGHALDAALDGVSGTAAFRTAHAEDARDLDAADRAGLAYFLQPGRAGPEETFAELFAQLHGEALTAHDLPGRFPRAAAILRDLLQ
jgi:hypothetical protein